ncbi:MAG TPA: hypothetical protein VNS59_10290 [Lysobacter sp.]|jgi:uncharacterized lipoprotein|nr:hypothetical protein [Lysobacter sp.]
MRVRNSFARTAVLAFAVATLASGCSWFHKDSKLYTQNVEARPLEVPPDLDRPSVDAAMKLPATASAVAPSTPVQSGASPIGFTVPGARDAIFAKVGDALAATEGVTVASRAQILGTYDVSYGGSNFLVRVTAVDAGVYVSAVDPRGLPASGEAPQKLIAALKAALGG